MTTAYVLSGGASLGAVQVGMLQALAAYAAPPPDMLVGTSAGALNASFIAGRDTGPTTLDHLAEVWRSLRTWQLFPPDPLTTVGTLLGHGTAFFSDRGIKRLIGSHLTFDRLEDAGIPLTVVATDLLTGEEVDMDTGPAREAILASSAIPAMLPAVERRGQYLVDGGLADNTPISRAVHAGADTIYVLPCGFACALDSPPTNALGTLLQTMSIMIHQRLIRDIDLYADTAELIVLPPPCPLTVNPIDFGHADELISTSRAAAQKFLAVDGGRRTAPSAHIGMHAHHAHDAA